MKTNLKLNTLVKNTMNEKEMQHIKGGRNCSCGCCYANNGGSSVNDNALANWGGGTNGLKSPNCKAALNLQ